MQKVGTETITSAHATWLHRWQQTDCDEAGCIELSRLEHFMETEPAADWGEIELKQALAEEMYAQGCDDQAVRIYRSALADAERIAPAPALAA